MPVVQLATRMLHQWRGHWTLSDCKSLSVSGVLAEMESWLREVWTDAPTFLASGRVVAVNTDNGRKGIVEKSFSQEPQADDDTAHVHKDGDGHTHTSDTSDTSERTFVRIRRGFSKIGKLEDVETTLAPEWQEVEACEHDGCQNIPAFGLLTDPEPSKRWCFAHESEHEGAVNLKYKDRFRPKNKLLVCRLFEFLSQSNNPFEPLFNLLQFFAEDFLLAETASSRCDFGPVQPHGTTGMPCRVVGHSSHALTLAHQFVTRLYVLVCCSAASRRNYKYNTHKLETIAAQVIPGKSDPISHALTSSSLSHVPLLLSS